VNQGALPWAESLPTGGAGLEGFWREMGLRRSSLSSSLSFVCGENCGFALAGGVSDAARGRQALDCEPMLKAGYSPL